MSQFKRDFNEYYCGARNLEETRSLNPSLQSFEEWLARNKERIPLQQDSPNSGWRQSVLGIDLD